MRILVHEFVSGGGFAGRDVPASLAREGAAMRTALVADLAAIGRHQIVTTVDPRFPFEAPPGVEVVTLPRGSGALLDAPHRSADAVWLVAPETDRLPRAPGGEGGAEGERRSSVPARRRSAGRPTRRASRAAWPATACPTRRRASSGPGADWAERPRARSAIRSSSSPRAEPVATECASRATRESCATPWTWLAGPMEAGRCCFSATCAGVAASVSLLADGRRAVALTVNAQSVRASRPFAYRGGTTPLDHPLAGRAVEAALRTCQALPGLRGYVGVDLVLTDSEAVVIEVNPRLTTAYLGVRSAWRTRSGNVAALALAACAGDLPAPPPVRRRVRFTAAGRIVSVTRNPVLRRS